LLSGIEAKLKISNADKVNLIFRYKGKNGQKSVSQLANHRLQPLGHLSVCLLIKALIAVIHRKFTNYVDKLQH
jgi:hypothetical protein